jgi:hypothetical protein
VGVLCAIVPALPVLWQHTNARMSVVHSIAAHHQADEVDKTSLIAALRRRGIATDESTRRWVQVDQMLVWATTFLPPEARAAREAELTWLREVEELGG